MKIDNNTLVHSLMKRVVDNLGTVALFFFFFVTAPHTWDEKALDYPEDGKYVFDTKSIDTRNALHFFVIPNYSPTNECIYLSDFFPFRIGMHFKV